MPTMAGAFAYDLYKNRDVLSAADLPIIAVGFVAAFVMAVIVVRYLLDYVSRHGFALFAWWRLAGRRRRTGRAVGLGLRLRESCKPAPQKVERQDRDADTEPFAERLFRQAVEQLRAVDGAQKARQDHCRNQRQPVPEGEPGQPEDDDLQEMLRRHAGGMGRDQRLAVVLEEPCEQHRDQRSGRPDQHAEQGKDDACHGQPGAGQPLDARDLRPGQHQDEAAEHQLQQRVRKLHHQEDAADRPDHAAGDERPATSMRTNAR